MQHPVGIPGEWASFLCGALNPARTTHVVDVGANPIDRPIYADLLEQGGCMLTGFEPQEGAHEALVNNARDNEVYLLAAVGDGETHSLNMYRNSGFTSLFEISAPSINFLGSFVNKTTLVRKAYTKTVRLDDVDGLSHCDMLKIDVQGAEHLIISNGRRLLSQAIAIVPELRYYRLYKGEPLVGELDSLLREMGFALHKFLPTKSTMIGNSQAGRLRSRRVANQLIDGDAAYIRNLEKPDELTDEQIKHLAICADGMFQSFDLAVHCLDILVARGAVTAETPERYVDTLPMSVRRS